MDNNFVYFSGYVTVLEKLLPYKTGLVLQRINTTVEHLTNVFINGNFPIVIP